MTAAIAGAIKELFERDQHLLTVNVNVNENTIAARLVLYVLPRIGQAPDGAPWDVDFDYSRQQHRVKVVFGDQLVRPDLIVHRRNTDEMNHLVVELKKGSSTKPDAEDIANLEAYKLPLEQGGLAYSHALFLRFGVQATAGTVTCVDWQ